MWRVRAAAHGSAARGMQCATGLHQLISSRRLGLGLPLPCSCRRLLAPAPTLQPPTCPAPAGLLQQLETAAAQLQQFGEEQAQLASLQWRFDRLQKAYNATDGLLNQTQATLDRVAQELEAAIDANGEPGGDAQQGRALLRCAALR